MERTLRVVLDSNVYISGLVFGGGPAIILTSAVGGSFQLYVSAVLCDEVEATLRDKFDWSDEEIRAGSGPLWESARHVEPTQRLNIVAADPDDDRILECAVAADADFLVTQDRGVCTGDEEVRQAV